ncbi:MAG: Ig-like domain-containing protein [Candidatus Omnitrophota bacterium]
MRKRNKVIVFLFLFTFLSGAACFSEYKETVILGRKVISGITPQEAIERFGIPTRGDKEFWYYGQPYSAYIYFSDLSRKANLFIFPYRYEIDIGLPFEIKAFVVYPDSRIKEVTSYVNWAITLHPDEDPLKSNLERIVKREESFFMPLTDGRVIISATYQNMVSNSCGVLINPFKEEDEEENQEFFFDIKIFPLRPVVRQRNPLEFSAFGIFRDLSVKKVYVTDITRRCEWFIYKDGKEVETKNSMLFLQSGEYQVFCRYRNKKSNTRNVLVKQDVLYHREEVKDFSLLPDFVEGEVGDVVEMEAVLTHGDNAVRTVSDLSSWDVSDKKIARFTSRGVLRLEREGIITASARFGDRLISSAKISVKKSIDKEKKRFVKEVKNKFQTYLSEEERVEPKVNRDETRGRDKQDEYKKETKIKEDIDDIAKKLLSKGGGIQSINVKPRFLTIPLGRTAEYKAIAEYFDRSSVDVTFLAQWVSSNSSYATVDKGLLTSLSSGEAVIHAYLEGKASNPARIVIGAPELVSIALSRKDKTVYPGQIVSLTATGHYSDGSQDNITGQVKWHVKNIGILKPLNDGNFKAGKRGQTEVSAQYQEIKSLPLSVTVRLSFGQVLRTILIVFVALIIFCLGLFYCLIKVRIYRFKKLIADNPPEFINKLYNNSKEILKVFGVPRDAVTPPIKHAYSVEHRFAIGDGNFLKLAYKFAEARYSDHSLTADDAREALYNYNNSMRAIRVKGKKVLAKIIVLLLRGLPFIIII